MQIENIPQLENKEKDIRRYAKQGVYVLALSLMPLFLKSDKSTVEKYNTDEIYTEWLVSTEEESNLQAINQLPKLEQKEDLSKGLKPEKEVQNDFKDKEQFLNITIKSILNYKEIKSYSHGLDPTQELLQVSTFSESKKKIKPLKVESTKNNLSITIDSLVNALSDQDGIMAKALGKKLAKYKEETTASIENIPNFKKEKIVVIHFLEKEKSLELFVEDPELREMQINLAGMIYCMYKTGVLRDITNPKKDMGMINILGALGETFKLYENINKDLEKTEKLYNSSRIPVFENYVESLSTEQQENLNMKEATKDVGLISTVLRHLKKIVEEKGAYFRNASEAKILKDASENNNEDKMAIMFNDILADHPSLVKLFKQLIDDLSKK